MTSPRPACDFVRGVVRCRAKTLASGGTRCYVHTPERLAYAEQRRDELAQHDAARGIRRCDAITTAGVRCFNHALPTAPTCAQHDPEAIQERARAASEYIHGKTRELAIAAVQRRLELEQGIDQLTRRRTALVREDIALRRDIRDRRAELTRLERELDAKRNGKPATRHTEDLTP